MTRPFASWPLMAFVAWAITAPVHAQSRGELLYTTHCVACHGTQIHWREKRLVTDWGSLLVQVRRWQANAALGWAEEDVVQVARHLNDTIYRFPRPLARQALMVSLARPPLL
ncbi:MAG: hypothetical protein Tsb007_46080 [Rhizobacter sp.]